MRHCDALNKNTCFIMCILYAVTYAYVNRGLLAWFALPCPFMLDCAWQIKYLSILPQWLCTCLSVECVCVEQTPFVNRSSDSCVATKMRMNWKDWWKTCGWAARLFYSAPLRRDTPQQRCHRIVMIMIILIIFTHKSKNRWLLLLAFKKTKHTRGTLFNVDKTMCTRG